MQSTLRQDPHEEQLGCNEPKSHEQKQELHLVLSLAQLHLHKAVIETHLGSESLLGLNPLRLLQLRQPLVLRSRP